MPEKKADNTKQKIHSHLAHVSNFGDCDYYKTTGFSIQSLGTQTEIQHILNMIKHSKENEIYLVLENLDILGHKEFYSQLLNKQIYITTNDYSSIIELIKTESKRDNGLVIVNIDNNKTSNELQLIKMRLKIPVSLISYLEKNIIDSCSLIIELLQYNIDETIDEEFIILNISMLHYTNMFSKLYKEFKNPENKILSNYTIEKLCTLLIEHLHNFYEKYKDTLSKSNITLGKKYIDKIASSEINDRKRIIEEYVNTKAKPQLVDISNYISGYTRENTSFSVWSLCIALILLPFSIMAAGIGAGLAGAAGVVSMSTAVTGIVLSFVSIGYSVYNFIEIQNNMHSNQRALYELCNNLYFTKILEHFYNIISPLMEFGYSIRGNYLYNKESIYIYNTTFNAPNYLKKYFIRCNDKNNDNLIKFFNDFSLTEKDNNKTLKIISKNWFELYKSHEKLNIFNQNYLNSTSIIYIETPQFTTPILTSTFKQILDKNKTHQNIICFSNSLNETQGVFIKNELEERLSIKPGYISYNHGEEDTRRNYAMYDYSFYDLVMANNENKDENTSKLMFFSLFHYKGYYQIYNKVYNLLQSLKQYTDKFIDIVKKEINHSSYIHDVKKEIYSYISSANTVKNNLSSLSLIDSQKKPYFYISNILNSLNQHRIYLKTLNGFCKPNNDSEKIYNLCLNYINQIFSILGNYHIVLFNSNNEFYNKYKKFITNNISDYLLNYCDYENNKPAYELSMAHLLTNYSIYDNMDDLVEMLNKKNYNTLNTLFRNIYNEILNIIKPVKDEDKEIFDTLLKYVGCVYYNILSFSINLNPKIIDDISLRYNTDAIVMQSHIVNYYFEEFTYTNIYYNYYTTTDYQIQIILEDIYYILENEINPNEYIQSKHIRIVLEAIIQYFNSCYSSYSFSKSGSKLILFYQTYKNTIKINADEFNVLTVEETDAAPFSDRDIQIMLMLSFPDIADITGKTINTAIDKLNSIKNSKILSSNTKLSISNFAGLAVTGLNIVANYILISFYNIPDEENLKEYIELYNYMYLNHNIIQPHTCINSHTICSPIYLHNNLSVIDNHHVLFGDKNMDINFLQNSYSLYANLKTDNVNIFYDRMYTILTGVGIEGLENILLQQKEKEYKFIQENFSSTMFNKLEINKIITKAKEKEKNEYNFLNSEKDINNFLNQYFTFSSDFYIMKKSVSDFFKYNYKIGAANAWKYIIDAYNYKEKHNHDILNIDIDIIKLMLGLTDSINNKKNKIKKIYNEQYDTDNQATITAKSFYHVVSYVSGKEIDKNLIPFKLKSNDKIKNKSEVATQTQSDDKIKYTFTESLHEIAKQNLYSAYINDEYIESMENKNNDVIRNRQPFIGIITLWVLPQNLMRG